jgi:drug/metabolite transporter (DMT)-like permease
MAGRCAGKVKVLKVNAGSNPKGPPRLLSASLPARNGLGDGYFNPPVTLLWAWALFAEPLNWVMAAGILVALAGVAMAATGRIRTG